MSSTPPPAPKGMSNGTYGTTPFSPAPPPPLPPTTGPAPPQGTGQAQWANYHPPGSAPHAAYQGQHPAGPSGPYPPPASGPKNLIYPKDAPTSPAIAALLSFLIVGLGQIILGQTTKGVALLVGAIVLGFFTLGLASLALWIVGIIDAYAIAKKLQAGQPVGEWEFF